MDAEYAIDAYADFIIQLKDLPNSKLKIIPESGHLVQEEKSEAVNQAILAYVR